MIVKAISEFIVHVFDLIEAEGRGLLKVVRGEAHRARAIFANLATGVAVLLISIPLIVAGLGLAAAGLMWWLEGLVGRPLAAGLTGLAVLGVGIGCFVYFRVLANRRVP